MRDLKRYQALLDVLEEMTAATVEDLEQRVHRLLTEYWETRRVCGRKLVSNSWTTSATPVCFASKGVDQSSNDWYS